MRVRNVHERRFSAPIEEVGKLIDGLGSADDRFWPSPQWPPMRLDRPLSVGAVGGHGPIRYSVEAYEPGKRVRFRISAPRGFDGYHGFEVEGAGENTTLRHVLEIDARGSALFTWPIIFAPLHDALLEDCLDRAAQALHEPARAPGWSMTVRFLRKVLMALGAGR